MHDDMAADDRYRELFRRSLDGILIMEGGQFIDCNPAALRMLRFPSRKALFDFFEDAPVISGHLAHPAVISPPKQPDGRDSIEKAEEILAYTFQRGHHTFEWMHTCADGAPLLCEVQLTVVRAGDTPLLHVVLRDVAQRKRNEAAIRRLRRTLARAQENERSRIARELHDDLSQRLAALVMDVEAVRQGITDETPSAALSRDSAEIQSVLEDVHGLSRRLHPTIIEDLGIFQALSSECAKRGRISGLRIDLQTSGAAPESSEVALASLRVVQEALHNVARHAAAREVGVEVCNSDGWLSIRVEDDGCGFDPQGTSGEGIGIASMRERTQLLGGHFTMRSIEGTGTIVEVRIPSDGAPAPDLAVT